MGRILVSRAAIALLAINSACQFSQGEPAAAASEEPSAPVITAIPAPVMVRPGEQVVLTVSATGVPEPTFTWYRDGGLLPGRTGATLVIAAASAADAGIYTVDAVNQAGSFRSGRIPVNVLSDVALTASFPSTSATGIPPDSQIPLLFDRGVRPGNTGRITIRDADGALADTIDMGLASHTRTVGGLAYTADPVVADGPQAWVVPRAGALAYGKSYYMLIEPGALRDAAGGAFAGLEDPALVRFSTRASGPPPGATVLRVAADGSGDFATVQGAIDHVPAANTVPVTIRVAPGTYRELLHIPSTKPHITLQGEGRDAVTVTCLNNANRNPGNQRASFYSKASDLVLDSMTFVNTTPKGGSQAETLNSEGNRVVVRDCAFLSLQDTIKLSKGGVYFHGCYIEGDVDFLWGDARVFLEGCTIHSVNKGYLVQVRNGQNARGFVFVRCRLTGAAGAAGTYLGRIDPGVYPYSEAAFIGCAMGPHIAARGWLLNNAASAPDVRFLEHGSTTLDGAALDLSGRMADATVLDAAGAAPYRDPVWVTGFNPVPSAWAAALRARDASGWSHDSVLGWNWGYAFARGDGGFFLWSQTFGGWTYAYPAAADSAFLFSYVDGRSGWFWTSRANGRWVWDYSAQAWLALAG